MDQKRPRYPLEEVKRLIQAGSYRITTTARLRAAEDFGLHTEADILLHVLALNRREFVKSMTSLKDHRLWQDVYCAQVRGAKAYVKLQILGSSEGGNYLPQGMDIVMRDKKWVDCPSCGAKGTMRLETNRTERWTPKGYPPIKVDGIEGYFCRECGEGFWTRASEKRITEASAEHRAKCDARVTPASELMSVSEAAKILDVSPQAVHQMMHAGRIHYVLAADLRLPIRKHVLEALPANKAPRKALPKAEKMERRARTSGGR